MLYSLVLEMDLEQRRALSNGEKDGIRSMKESIEGDLHFSTNETQLPSSDNAIFRGKDLCRTMLRARSRGVRGTEEDMEAN